MIRVHGKDDRGRAAGLLLGDPVDIPPGGNVESLLCAFRTVISLGGTVLRSRAGWYILLSFALFVGDAVALWRAGPMAMFLVLSSPVGSIVLLLLVNALVGLWRAIDDRRLEAKSRWLSVGRCPHCGYQMASEATDPAEGLQTCSECGCGWKPFVASDGPIVIPRPA